MKKIMSIVLVAVLLFSITACSGGNGPDKVVNTFLTHMQKGEYAEVNKLVKGSTSELDDAFGSTDDLGASEKMLVEAMQDFTYKIGKVNEIDKETATVDVSFEVLDFGGIMGEIIGELMTQAMSNPEMDEEKMDEIMTGLLEEALKDKTREKLTLDVAVDVVKEDGTWKLNMDDSEDLLNALTGNMMTALGGLGL